jgi:hypothetical protein
MIVLQELKKTHMMMPHASVKRDISWVFKGCTSGYLAQRLKTELIILS